MLINKLQDIRYNGKLKLGSFVFINNVKLIIDKVHYFFVIPTMKQITHLIIQYTTLWITKRVIIY